MSTYDYNTRKITRSFKIRRDGEKCKLGGLPAKIGNHFCSCLCKYNCGGLMDIRSSSIDVFFTKCNHPEAKDSEGINSVVQLWEDEFEEEALSHFYD